MLSRVYALRPYVNIIKHSEKKYEVSIMYMPYYRGVNYLITHISHQESPKPHPDGSARMEVICWLSPVDDLSFSTEIVSDTYFLEDFDLNKYKYIDTKFEFELVNERQPRSFAPIKGKMMMMKSGAAGEDGPGGNDGNHQNSNSVGNSGGTRTP